MEEPTPIGTDRTNGFEFSLKLMAGPGVWDQTHAVMHCMLKCTHQLTKMLVCALTVTVESKAQVLTLWGGAL